MIKESNGLTEIKLQEDGTTKVFTTTHKHIHKLLNQFGEDSFDEIEFSSEGAVISILAENLEGFEFSILKAK